MTELSDREQEFESAINALKPVVEPRTRSWGYRRQIDFIASGFRRIRNPRWLVHQRPNGTGELQPYPPAKIKGQLDGLEPKLRNAAIALGGLHPLAQFHLLLDENHEPRIGDKKPITDADLDALVERLNRIAGSCPAAAESVPVKSEGGPQPDFATHWLVRMCIKLFEKARKENAKPHSKDLHDFVVIVYGMALGHPPGTELKRIIQSECKKLHYQE